MRGRSVRARGHTASLSTASSAGSEDSEYVVPSTEFRKRKRREESRQKVKDSELEFVASGDGSAAREAARRLRNRESARRSRLQKQQASNQLAERVASLSCTNAALRRALEEQKVHMRTQAEEILALKRLLVPADSCHVAPTFPAATSAAISATLTQSTPSIGPTTSAIGVKTWDHIGVPHLPPPMHPGVGC